MRLSYDFFTADAPELAPMLLGKLLCRKTGDGVIRLPITETECYFGEDDTACHAHKGRTARTGIMYGRGGMTYIYLCYGMHNLLNVVSGEEGSPQAVLIRGAGDYNGPGKLTKALSIDRSLNGVDLSVSGRLWLEDGKAPTSYVTTPRIGISYAAKEDRERLWRFVAER